LQVAQMMCIRRRAAADQAGLPGHRAQVFTAAAAPRFGACDDSFFGRVRLYRFILLILLSQGPLGLPLDLVGN
jgi:hypothetical protein